VVCLVEVDHGHVEEVLIPDPRAGGASRAEAAGPVARLAAEGGVSDGSISATVAEVGKAPAEKLPSPVNGNGCR
jgi:hypothetical protein